MNTVIFKKSSRIFIRGDFLDNKTLQGLIYNQLYAASMYNLLAEISPDRQTQLKMLSFKADSNNNASRLDRYYQEVNTSSYNPIVKQPIDHGSFIETILWMLNYEGNTFRLFANESFNTKNSAFEQRLTQYISTISSSHGTFLTHIYLNNS